jgi:hypothetical protein
MPIQDSGVITASSFLQKTNFNDNICYVDKLSTTSKDNFQGGYSIKLLVSNYSGPMINVRRDNDNATLDFYGDENGNLGTEYNANGTTLISWLAGSVGYVKILYDQSGNGRHVKSNSNSTDPFITPSPIKEMLSVSGQTAVRSMFCLFRASSAYTGPTIQLRRESDNAILDFYADNNYNLTTGINGTGSTYRSWANSTTRVTIWYDQSGNGNHAIQPTTTLQPYLDRNSIVFSRIIFDAGKYLQSNTTTNSIGIPATTDSATATTSSWTITGNTNLTLTTVATGTFKVGMTLTGTNITGSPKILYFSSGTGGSGSVAVLSVSQTNNTGTLLTGTPALNYTFIFNHQYLAANSILFSNSINQLSIDRGVYLTNTLSNKKFPSYNQLAIYDGTKSVVTYSPNNHNIYINGNVNNNTTTTTNTAVTASGTQYIGTNSTSLASNTYCEIDTIFIFDDQLSTVDRAIASSFNLGSPGYNILYNANSFLIKSISPTDLVCEYPPNGLITTSGTTTISGQFSNYNGDYIISTSAGDGSLALREDYTSFWSPATSYNTNTGRVDSPANTTTINGIVYGGGFIQIQLPIAIVLKTYSLAGHSSTFASSSPRQFAILGNNNLSPGNGDSGWVLVDYQDGINDWDNRDKIFRVKNNVSSFRVFRLYVREISNSYSSSSSTLSLGRFKLNPVNGIQRGSKSHSVLSDSNCLTNIGNKYIVNTGTASTNTAFGTYFNSDLFRVMGFANDTNDILNVPMNSQRKIVTTMNNNLTTNNVTVYDNFSIHQNTSTTPSNLNLAYADFRIGSRVDNSSEKFIGFINEVLVFSNTLNENDALMYFQGINAGVTIKENPKSKLNLRFDNKLNSTPLPSNPFILLTMDNIKFGSNNTTDTFYQGTVNPSKLIKSWGDFNCSAQIVSITSITTGADPIITTSAAHNYMVGITVSFYDTNSTPVINNTYTINTVPSTTTFTVTSPPTITVAGTSGYIIPYGSLYDPTYSFNDYRYYNSNGVGGTGYENDNGQINTIYTTGFKSTLSRPWTPATSGFTVVCTILNGDDATDKPIFFIGNTGNLNNSITAYKGANVRYYFTIRSGSGTDLALATTRNNIADRNKWDLMVFRYTESDKSYEIYRNGTLEGRAIGTVSPGNITTDNNLLSMNNSVTGKFWFSGFAAYNKSLSLEEITNVSNHLIWSRNFSTSPNLTQNVIKSGLTYNVPGFGSSIGRFHDPNSFYEIRDVPDLPISLSVRFCAHTFTNLFARTINWSITGNVLTVNALESDGYRLEVGMTLFTSLFTARPVITSIVSGMGSDTSVYLLDSSPGTFSSTTIFLNGLWHYMSIISLTDSPNVTSTSNISLDYDQFGKRLLVRSQTATYSIAEPLEDISVNVWYHITVTISETCKIMCYINGALVKTVRSAQIPSSRCRILLGKSSQTDITKRFNGYLKDFKVYDYILRKDQIAQMVYSSNLQIINTGNSKNNFLINNLTFNKTTINDTNQISSSKYIRNQEVFCGFGGQRLLYNNERIQDYQSFRLSFDFVGRDYGADSDGFVIGHTGIGGRVNTMGGPGIIVGFRSFGDWGVYLRINGTSVRYVNQIDWGRNIPINVIVVYNRSSINTFSVFFNGVLIINYSLKNIEEWIGISGNYWSFYSETGAHQHISNIKNVQLDYVPYLDKTKSGSGSEILGNFGSVGSSGTPGSGYSLGALVKAGYSSGSIGDMRNKQRGLVDGLTWKLYDGYVVDPKLYKYQAIGRGTKFSSIDNCTQDTFSSYSTSYNDNTYLIQQLSGTATGAMRGMYALYRLNSTYTGPTITLRSNKTNVGQDFYADINGNLTTNTGISFRAWYDTECACNYTILEHNIVQADNQNWNNESNTSPYTWGVLITGRDQNPLFNGYYRVSSSSEYQREDLYAYNVFRRVYVQESRVWHINPNTYNSTTGAYAGSTSTTVGTAQTGEWLQVQLPNALRVTSFVISAHYDTNSLKRFIKSFILAGSNDGSTWTSIKDVTDAQIDKYGAHIYTVNRDHFFDCSSNTVSYTYYRIIARSMIGGYDGYLMLARLKLNAYIPTATEKAKVRVVKWWDQSGSGRHATQEECMYNQPIYNPDTNTIDFGGNDQSFFNLGIHTQYTINSATLNNTSVTVTTTAAHGFVVGSIVTIVNATGGTMLNGTYTVLTVPTTTTFTITIPVAIASYTTNSGTVSTPTDTTNPVQSGRPSYTFVAKVGKYDKAQSNAIFGAGTEANYSRNFFYIETNGWSYFNWYNDEAIGPEVFEDSTLTHRYDRTNRIGYLNGVQQQNYAGAYSTTNLNLTLSKQYLGNFPNFDTNYPFNGQMKSFFIFSSAADSNGALSDADRKLCEEDTFSLPTTIEFVGYFLPPVTANYTFSVNNVDDIARGWIGANANNGYTANNTTFSASLSGATLTTTSGTVSMVKNTYYPIRMLYSQNTAKSQFQLSASQSTPLLDRMSSAGKSACRGAYALFLLNNSYTGPIITLRSNVGSVEQVFYATVCGLLTTTGINTGTNYQTWLLANNSTFSYVKQWYDQSGNGRHATQTTTTLQPTYTGTDSIDFGGQTNAYLLLGGATDGPIPYGSNPSFTSVVKQGTVQGNRGSGAFYSNYTASTNRSNVLRFDGAAGYRHYFFNNDTTYPQVRPDNIVSVTYDGINLRKMYLNNIYKSQTGSAYGNIVDQQQYMGITNPPSTEPLNGEIQSMMFFSTVLSDSDLIVVNDQNIFDFTGEFFSSNGTISTLPAESAKIIKDTSNTNIDGIYYISCGGVSTPIYCLMNDVYNGGGWMMLMKGLRGSTFNYTSNYWTTTNTLNPTEVSILPGDSKYDTFNYSTISDVMAIFPDIKPKSYTNIYGTYGGSLLLEDGWCWKVDNWGKTLPMMQMLSTTGYNSARAMYALVLVNKNYTGPTIRLDGVDYYADVAGEMNTSYNRTGTNFYGTTGLVDIWYDQSGNGRNATQTGSNRPFYNGSFIDFTTDKFLNAGAAGDGPFISNATASSWNISGGTTLTLTTVSAGKFSVGLVLSGSGISGSPVIVSFTSGSGGSGSVALISSSQTNTTSTNTLTGTSTNLPFTYIYKHGNFSGNLVFIAGPSTTNQSINIYIDPGTRYLHYFWFDDDSVYTPPVINNIVSYKFDRANYNRQFYINSIPGVISRQYNSNGYTLGTGIQQIIGSGTIQLQYFYVFDSALTDDDRLVAENNMTGNVNITPLEGFNTSRDAGNMGNPLNFTGNSGTSGNSIFSYQANRRHVFGGGSHVYKGLNPSRKVRWGIMSNNDNDFQSVDSNTGIGLTESMSAGDFRFINDGTTGLQRSFLFQMYGR